MDRLDIAIELIREAQSERNRLEKMEGELEKLNKCDLDFSDYRRRRYEIETKYSPLPHKSVINDNLKMARRILLGEYEKG